MSQIIEEREYGIFSRHLPTHISLSKIPLDFETLHDPDSPVSVYSFIGSFSSVS